MVLIVRIGYNFASRSVAGPPIVITLNAIYRYPVKGMTPERLETVTLTAGGTLPADRKYAIENGPGRFDPAAPRHLPKITFLMLMRDERLATLQSVFDDTTETLTILRDGRQVARGKLDTPTGRQLIEQFFAAYMKGELRGAPRIVSAEGHSFSDVAAKCVHIVNLETVRDLERIAGQPVDPLRFRANLYIEGLAPWSEFNWLDKTISIGATQLEVYKRTERCNATNVDPVTAKRDMAIPALLTRNWGHTDVGLYAKISVGGAIATGNVVTVG
jgi:uncharacterized protein